MIKRFLLACALTLMTACPLWAGPVLDEILNYMYLDQTTPMVNRAEMFKVDLLMNLVKDEPIGQTFITGTETERIVRVRGWIRPNADWQPGEGVELVLWDSPQKKVSLGRYTIWYEYRGFQFERPEWEINARVQPNTTYYFELSYVGKGDGKLSEVGLRKGSDSYKPGQGYLAGKEADFDFCFQTHVKRPMDRVGNLKKMFAMFKLDLPELAEVKAAVEKEDFETAIAKLVGYFEARQKPVPIIPPGKSPPKYNPNFDTTYADLTMQNCFASQEMGRGYAGPDINWRGEPDFNPDGTIAASFWNTGINRYGPRGPLCSGYLNTGNEKYIKKLNDVLIDWYLDNPPPGESKIGGDGSDPVWATLDAGTRAGAGFTAYAHMVTSPYFTLDGRMAFIINLANNADTLILNGEGAGGNWSFTQNGSMFNLGVDFPEFANAEIWREAASKRLAGSIKKDILPDGVEMESAPGYQRMSYNPLEGLYKLTQERGLKTDFTDGLKDVLEGQAEYFMYLAAPDGTTPFLGDWGNTNEKGPLKSDSEMLGRQDMLYVATAGKEGTKPKELSKLYPYCGVVTMRSDWGNAGRPYEDGRYLMLHGLYRGAHGHDDLNEVTLYAYGRELIADPGSYEYGSPEHTLLGRSVSHNLMTIDGQDQGKRVKAEFRNWSTTPVADYVSSWIAAYAAGNHNREVFYIRANGDPGVRDYWIVRDIAEGEGKHSLEQRWHFVPGEAKFDPATLTAQTAFAEGGNVAVTQIDPSRLKVEQTTADRWVPRAQAKKPSKMPTFIYRTEATLPAAIDTVLFPFEGKQAPIQPKVLEKSADGLSSAFKMIQGKVQDLFILQKSAGKKSLCSEKVSFVGERLFVRRVNGNLRSLLLVNGASVTIDGKEKVKSAKPLSWVAVSFDSKGAKVYASSNEPSLIVPGVKSKPAVVVMNTDELIRRK
ncbi:MAG: alginate lyase family protein [Armatimonadota bacterium]|nr:alginate lyase family protein [Armatimonadota bacterium]